MFISKNEKLYIKERIDAIGMALVETSERANAATAAAENAQENIPNIRKTNKTLMDNIWNLDAKIESLNTKVADLQSTATLVTGMAEQIKIMRVSITSLERENEALVKSNQSLFASFSTLGNRKPIGRPTKKLVISHESVLALKEAGFWDDAEKRTALIDHLVKETQNKKTAEQKERQRQHSRNYYLRKKAERLAKEAA
jgi:uncharacterized phage infection (PIP) family protein YhgE